MLLPYVALLLNALLLPNVASHPQGDNPPAVNDDPFLNATTGNYVNYPAPECYYDIVGYPTLDFSTCSGAISSLEKEPAYPDGRQFWRQPRAYPPYYFLSWTAPGSDCFIGLTSASANVQGKFFLQNVVEDLPLLQAACPGKGGKWFLYTRNFSPRQPIDPHLGWFVEVRNITAPKPGSITVL